MRIEEKGERKPVLGLEDPVARGRRRGTEERQEAQLKQKGKCGIVDEME